MRLFARSPSSLRLVIAPAGFGKTTLAQQLAAADAASRYVAIAPHWDAADVFGAILSRMDVDERPALDNVHEAVVRSGITDLLVDDAHLASAGGHKALNELHCAMPRLRLTLFGSSCDVIQEPRWLFDGTCHVLDSRALAFDSTDVEELCASLGVPYDADAVPPFLDRTSGWPVVVRGCIAVAAAHGARLENAFDLWRSSHAESFLRWVATQAERLPHGGDFMQALMHRRNVDRDEAAIWEREGLFVSRRPDGAIVLLQPLRSMFGDFVDDAVRAAGATPMVAAVLGELRVQIGGMPVQWVRRKDAQVFKYLLLKPTGKATRVELMRVFWPGREARIAAQNLRTTCSNIRHAIRSIVGEQHVAAYFRSQGDVTVAFENIVLDVQEFRKHVQAYRAAADRARRRDACAHLERARELYRGDLLVDMPQCGFDAAATELRLMLGEVLHGLQLISTERPPLAAI